MQVRSTLLGNHELDEESRKHLEQEIKSNFAKDIFSHNIDAAYERLKTTMPEVGRLNDVMVSKNTKRPITSQYDKERRVDVGKSISDEALAQYFERMKLSAGAVRRAMN